MPLSLVPSSSFSAPASQSEAGAALLLKGLAHRHGFLDCGIAGVAYLEEAASQLRAWLAAGKHGTMGYMADHAELRCNPRLLLKEARSVIVLLANYAPTHAHARMLSGRVPRIARYAYGKDYHKVLRKRLKPLLKEMREAFGAETQVRVCIDSAPVMESVWAARAGLGWKGKHSLLINKKYGSFFFLCVLLTNLVLAPDTPTRTDHCGTCTRCIDACPTQAIDPKTGVDARRCIAYLTIENKNPIPKPLAEQLNGWLFGCDICQEVCPWNRFAEPHTEPDFLPKSDLLNMTLDDWRSMQEESFHRLFAGSPLKRAGFAKIKDTLRAIEANV